MDPKKTRDAIKKVIAYMTQGIDVTRLFNEMVLAIETRDLVSLRCPQLADIGRDLALSAPLTT